MNYCEHHLGDYAKRTTAFSMLEHGAYAKLRDRYFVTEAGIPEGDVYRQAGARTKDERAAVEAVLLEFYRLADGAWVCDEFEDQLTQAQARIKAAQSNGKLGGRPKGTQKKPSGFSLGSDSVTQQKAHQTPDTKHQAPEIHTPPASPTEAGRVCGLLRRAGVADTNPGHPDLLALLNAGATDDEILGAARTTLDRQKGFAYLLGMLKRQRQEAAEAAASMLRGPLPAKAPTAAEQRALDAVPSIAAKHLRPVGAGFETIDVEATDVTARRLG